MSNEANQASSDRFFTERAPAMCQSINSYLSGLSDEHQVQAQINVVLRDWELGAFSEQPPQQDEEAFWCLLWSAQHLCSASHRLELAKRELEPILRAVIDKSSLPFGVTARRP